MNVDRPPASTDNPRPDARDDASRSTDSPAPENPPTADPETHLRAERAPDQEQRPEQERKPGQEQRPDQEQGPEQERKPDQERKPGQELKPGQEQRPEKAHDPAREHPPPSSPTETDSDCPANNTPDPAEPRSRQEHADDHSLADSARPFGSTDRSDQRQALPVKAVPFEEADAVEADLEDSPDELPSPSTAQESTPREENGHKYYADEALNGETNTPIFSHEYQGDPKTQGHIERAENLSQPSTTHEQGNRVRDVKDCLVKAHAADLASDHTHTTDPDRQQWTVERDRIHGEIVRDLYSGASEVPCEYRAIIAGGLGGAGKSTVLSGQLGVDQSQYLTINPDDIKEELARRGLVPEVEGLSPMEASDLVHEESSVIAKQLAHRAQRDGKNLIWDITMSSQESTQARIDDLRSAGYNPIDAIFVDIPIDTSIRRTQARHREGHDKWLAGEGLGGRFVPAEVILRQADQEWGSKNKKIFESSKASVNNWVMLDNSADGRRAVVVESSKPKNESRDFPRSRSDERD